MTTIVSLLQPPPEVFGLFDDLMFLCEGRMLYHGPLEGAVPHFTASGFIRPVRKDVASFLLEITTPTGRQGCLPQYACKAHTTITINAHIVWPGLGLLPKQGSPTGLLQN